MVTTDYQPQLSPHAQRSGHGAVQPFPPLEFGSTPIQTGQHIAPGTGFRVLLAWIPLAASLLAITLTTMGVGLVMALIAGYFMRKKIHARIRGSGVRVSPSQMPELHKLVEGFARRLGMKKMPEVYVVEDSTQNGFAAKLGAADIVLLTDDVVWGALQSSDPRALGFVVGHELAHVALGHTGTLRSMQRTAFPSLSRLDEFTCDNVATALVNDRHVAVKGVALLTVGPQLLPYINEQALAQQAKEVWADKQSKKAELGSHPLLFRRIANVLGAQW